MGIACTWVVDIRVIQEVVLLSTVLPRPVGMDGSGARCTSAPLSLSTLPIQQGFGSYP
jgi:hypothetical protein